MTDQEINIAIAESVGFERTDGWRSGWMLKTKEWPQGIPSNIPPNYVADLNAMSEAEETLRADQIQNYANALWHITSNSPIFWTFRSSARQRAEAYLKTIGKWKE